MRAGKKSPRVLVWDIETAPIIGCVWSIWEQNVGLNQIKKDWHLLAFAAKWLGDPPSKVIYRDQRNARRIDDDRAILKTLWKLLDEADVVITQNGKAFDAKKVNARFVLHGMQPPSSYKHIDLKQIAKKHFAFTSNKLEYLTDKLCTKYKKLKSKRFPGFELWSECLAGNLRAWDEMRRYNIRDVLSLEEAYSKLIPWDNATTLAVFSKDIVCSCGGKKFEKRGFFYTQVGKYQRWRCTACGSETRARENLFTAEERSKRRMSIKR